MNNLVKNVFLVWIGVVVAMLLYMALFGTYDLDGNSIVGTKTGNITQTSEWKGALWYAAETIEHPISKYYFDYCYLPTLHETDYVDLALTSITDNTTDLSSDLFTVGNYQTTKADLSDNTDKCKLTTDYSTSWF